MRVAVPLFAGLCLVFAAADSAEACGRRKVPRQKKQSQQAIQLRLARRAEALNAKGKHAAAVKTVRAKFGSDMTRFFEGDGQLDFIGERAQRAAALATVRSAGEVDLGGGWDGKTDESRARNVMWAVQVLQYQQSHNESLVVRTQYAEALAAVPSLRSAAFDVLDDLQTRDLLPTPESHAQLAQLQDERGDTTAADRSLQRCFDLGGDAATCSFDDGTIRA